ncbi:hypothetical protein BDQ12DRAFT_670839 [Crucibulum laeve]|uniref:Secreted protein n=1 Tax=Crucibulum laeve TaxID=68775 RepID=A0A5C3LJ74_9AGAR|nr:hypothetical protein BDQ12DRAFT_670839 [Crucibulum laeve]
MLLLRVSSLVLLRLRAHCCYAITHSEVEKGSAQESACIQRGCLYVNPAGECTAPATTIVVVDEAVFIDLPADAYAPFLRQLQLNNYSTVAAISFLIYDICINLGDEV